MYWVKVTATQVLTWVMDQLDDIKTIDDLERLKVELEDRRERILRKIAAEFDFN